MIVKGRVTAAHEGPVVVFVIGMRINRVLAVRKWWPVARAMQRMLAEIVPDPDSGFMGMEAMFRGFRTPVLMQYWRSFDQLHAYAHDRTRAHMPAWRAFNTAIGGDGSVGIFHETYIVAAGRHESLDANMPPFGLAAASDVMPATGSRNDARARLAAGAPAP